MSSAEQTGLTIVGGVVGFFASGMNPMGAVYGAQIGYSLGMSTLSTTLGPTHGPKIDDLKQQVATYGWDLPTGWGTNGHAGALMWSTDLEPTPHTTTQESGGKGAPSQSQSHTTYTYSISCAVAFGSREITAVRRIWANEHLLYDNSAASDYATMTDEELADWAVTKAGTLEEGEKLRIYLGTETQEPDPIIQAYEGVDNTPAFRGTPYFVCEDLQLERFGNRPPQYRVEYVKTSDAIDTSIDELIEVDLNAMGIADTLNYQTMVSTIDKDLTAHVWVPMYGGASPTPHIIAYYKVYPTGTATFMRYYTTLAPGGGAYREIIAGVDSEVPMLVHANSAVSGDATLRFPNGSILGGDYTNVQFPFSPYGTNGTVGSITQGGSAINGWMGVWDGADQYKTFNYHQSVGTYLVSTYAKFLTTSKEAFTLDVDVNLAGVTRTENYVYSYDLSEKLRRYSLNGVLLNTWDLGTSHSLNFINDLNDCLIASREDENIVYLRDVSVALYVIDVTDASDPQVTTFSGSIGNNESAAQTFQVWGGICACSTQKGVTYYSLADVSRGTADLADIVDELMADSDLAPGDYDTTALTGTSVSGFVKTRVSAATANIIPLMQAYQFSAYEDNHQLVFVPRGGAVDTTLLENDLGAGINEGTTELIPYERNDDQDLPLVVNVYYIDADLEYDRSCTSSRRTDIYGASQSMDIELPLVLTAEQARQVAEILHMNLWRARESYKKIKVPLKYLEIVPTNVVQSTVDSIVHRLRVTDVNVGEMLEIGGHAEGAIDYTSTISADNTSLVYKGSGIPGPTEAWYLNLPPLRTQDTNEGLYIAVNGPYAAWQGCVIYARADGGDWSEVTMTPGDREAQMGIVTEVAGDGEYHVMDNVNTLTIRLNFGTLSSVTRSQLMSSSSTNAIAVMQQTDINGNYPYQDARMEIIRFQTATLNADGTYTLSNLLRGQRGTEYAIPHMEEGDLVAVLDEDTLFRTTNLATNVRYELKAVSVGTSLDAAAIIRTSNLGQATKPFSPVDIRATDNEDGTFTLTWKRRPRAGGGLGTGDDDYQVESNLNWKIDVLEARYYAVERTYYVEDVSTATIIARNGYRVQISQYGFGYQGYGFPNDFTPLSSLTGFDLEGTILNDLADDLTIYITGDSSDIVDETSEGGEKYYLNKAQWNGLNIGESRYGIITGHEPSVVTGQVLQGIDFSGNPSGVGAAVEYIEFEVATSWITGALSFWFKPDGSKLTSMIMGNLNYHIRFYESGGVTAGVRISLNGTTGDVNFTVPTSGWHHLAINRLGDTFELWLDGVYQGVSSTATTATLPIEYIGVHRTSSHGYHSTWAYDQFRVWNNGKQLTQIEVNRLYGETA